MLYHATLRQHLDLESRRTNTRHRSNVGAWLVQRGRRWQNIIPALGQCLLQRQLKKQKSARDTPSKHNNIRTMLNQRRRLGRRCTKSFTNVSCLLGTTNKTVVHNNDVRSQKSVFVSCEVSRYCILVLHGITVTWMCESRSEVWISVTSLSLTKRAVIPTNYSPAIII